MKMHEIVTFPRIAIFQTEMFTAELLEQCVSEPTLSTESAYVNKSTIEGFHDTPKSLSQLLLKRGHVVCRHGIQLLEYQCAIIIIVQDAEDCTCVALKHDVSAVL